MKLNKSKIMFKRDVFDDTFDIDIPKFVVMYRKYSSIFYYNLYIIKPFIKIFS